MGWFIAGVVVGIVGTIIVLKTDLIRFKAVAETDSNDDVYGV